MLFTIQKLIALYIFLIPQNILNTHLFGFRQSQNLHKSFLHLPSIYYKNKSKISFCYFKNWIILFALILFLLNKPNLFICKFLDYFFITGLFFLILRAFFSLKIFLFIWLLLLFIILIMSSIMPLITGLLLALIIIILSPSTFVIIIIILWAFSYIFRVDLVWIFFRMRWRILLIIISHLLLIAISFLIIWIVVIIFASWILSLIIIVLLIVLIVFVWIWSIFISICVALILGFWLIHILYFVFKYLKIIKYYYLPLF